MSKTEENYIGITEKADDIFGKTMSIPDEIMMKWFDLLSLRPLEEIKKVEKDIKEGANPRDAKIDLAMELTTRFASENEAEKKQKIISLKKFSSNELPSDIEEKEIDYTNMPALPNLLKDLGMVGSTSEAIRLIETGRSKNRSRKGDFKRSKKLKSVSSK